MAAVAQGAPLSEAISVKKTDKPINIERLQSQAASGSITQNAARPRPWSPTPLPQNTLNAKQLVGKIIV